MERKVKELLKKKEKLFLTLSIPHQPVFETIQQKELLKLTVTVAQKGKLKEIFLKQKPKVILKKLKLLSPKIYSLLETHEQKWAWAGMEDWMYQPFTKERLAEMIKENLKTHKNHQKALFILEKKQKEIYQKAKTALKILKPNREELNLITLLQKYIWLRTARLEAFRKAHFYTKPLILEIGKRAKLLEEEVYSLTPKEITTFLKENKLPQKEIIRKRIKGYVILMIKGKVSVYSGEEWPEKFEKKFGLELKTISKIIKG